ncbi:hypothetical protein PROFUN_00315 [Planoprotostelium fungivorum]|uniref:Uncharacterized protein n=1 Tax=Planoprotostelium fungivorum TaxID=1890364 RepID=A0A2P6NY13_9EUKA|nr:hypothetical protein PROFUN_00315 [Planoprotostelium fungivorum]
MSPIVCLNGDLGGQGSFVKPDRHLEHGVLCGHKGLGTWHFVNVEGNMNISRLGAVLLLDQAAD